MKKVNGMSCRCGQPRGEAAALFYRHLCEGVLVGGLCGECGAVVVPPRGWCELCGGDTVEIREVGPRGVIIAHAVLPLGRHPVQGEEEAVHVLVRLAGADTSFAHFAQGDGAIVRGAVVVPLFDRGPDGSITGLRCFVPEQRDGEETANNLRTDGLK